jgi:DNA-binding CsgD family transcriptional regulator
MFIVAGTAYWSHMNIMSASSSVGLAGPLFPATDNLWLIALLGNLVALALMALISTRIRRFTHGSAWIVTSCVLVLAEIVLLLMLHVKALDQGMLWLAILLGGFGGGMTLVFFAEFFSHMSLQKILFYAGIQQLLAIFPYLALSLASPLVVLLSIVSLVVLQNAILIKMSRRPFDEGQRPFRIPWLNAKGATPILATTALLVGVCYGATLALTLASPKAILVSSDVWGAPIGALLLIASALLFSGKEPEGYLYQIALPLLALGLITIPLLTGGVSVALPLLLACSTYFFGILWFFVTLAHPNSHMAVGRLSAISFFCFFLGHLEGRLFIGFAPQTLRNASTVSIILLFVTILLLIVYISKHRAYEREIATRAEEMDFESGCALVALNYRLTAREQEIFRLLALGFSTRKIASKLVLSENTVNTHIHHIYLKLGIHSREELDEMLETTTREMTREQQSRPDPS